jgi:hypothetical protein
MSASLTLERRLQAHVEAILDRASVRASDRADMAEELYGHLWQRWQDGLGAAERPEIALDQAIAAFGEPSALGRDITGAFHSRLYASTIGVLLPSVAAAISEEPAGSMLLRLLFVAVIVQAVAGAVWALQTLTPLRLLVALVALALSSLAAILAIRAIGRGQRWALRLARVTVSAWLLVGMLDLVRGPGVNINLLGVLALVAALPAIGPDLEDWVAQSHPIRRRLAIPLTVALVAGFAVAPIAPLLPDPTQVGPQDLTMSVTQTCGVDATGAPTYTVEAHFKWNRLDAWPNGILRRPGQADPYAGQGMMSAYDGIAAGVISAPAWDVTEYAGALTDISPGTGAYISGEPTITGPDGSPVTDWLWGSTYWAGFGGGFGGYTIPQSALATGNTYTVRWDFSPLLTANGRPTPAGKYPPMAVVSYAHLDRFRIQAVATCDRPGVGVPAPPLVP